MTPIILSRLSVQGDILELLFQFQCSSRPHHFSHNAISFLHTTVVTADNSGKISLAVLLDVLKALDQTGMPGARIVEKLMNDIFQRFQIYLLDNSQTDASQLK